MVANSWFHVLGYYPAFRFPIGVPDYHVLEDAPAYVTLPQSWLPHICGAITPLMRPETWKADDDEAEVWAQDAQNLIHCFGQATSEPPGCDYPTPDGWTCEHDLLLSDGGLVPRTSNPTFGLWSLGVGWQATVAYNSGQGKYTRYLDLVWNFGARCLVTALEINYETECDFAPGGQAFRKYQLLLYDGSSTIRNYVRGYNAVSTLNKTEGFFWLTAPVYATKLIIQCFAGASSSESELDSTSWILKKLTLSGWSLPKPDSCET
jgi:hypothetical protein